MSISGRPAPPAQLALTLLALTLLAHRSAAGEPEHGLWDPAGLLPGAARADLEQRLEVAARRLGSPVYVLIARSLHRETAAQAADRAFADRNLAGSPSSNPVLLLVAAADRDAAIATGKGNAGVVPELDAARIVRRLRAHSGGQRLQAALAEAVDAIVLSGEDTLARRRPLTPEDDDLPPPDTSSAIGTTAARRGAPPRTVAAASAGAGGTEATIEQVEPFPNPERAGQEDPPGDGSAADLPPPARRRSRLPIAIGVAALIVLAIALRRRRAFSARSAALPPPPVEKPRLPSVIDRPAPTTRRPPRDRR